MTDHDCEPPADPRKQGTCVRCGRPIPPPPPAARPRRVNPARWLETARGILPTYPARVMARHQQAAAEYGDSWRTRPLVDLAAEPPEEGLDIGGWPMLIGERLDELDPAVRGEAAALVESLIRQGAQVTATADRLAALIAHHKAPR